MKKTLNVMLFIIGAVIFIYFIYDLGINNIIANIKKTGWWMIPVLGVWAAVYYLNGVSLYLLLGEKRRSIGLSMVFSLTLSGNAINFITPFAHLGGEPYRIMILGKYVGPGFAASKVILYKMIQWLSHLILWLVAIPIIPFLFPVSLSLTISLIAASLIMLLLVFFLISRHKRGMIESLYRLILKIPFLKRFTIKLIEKEKEIIEIDSYIKELYNSQKKLFSFVLFLEFSAKLISSLEFYFILYSIGIEISLFESFFILSAASLLLNIMSFIPMTLGVKEGGMFFIAKSLYISSGAGIYIALINRIRELFFIMAGLLLVQLNNRKADMKFNRESIKTGDIV